MNGDLELFDLQGASNQIKQNTFHAGKPRLKMANRNQIQFKIGSIDDLIPEDHIVRLVWAYVDQLDMNSILGTIQSVEGNVGRPATDPKILLSLWLYATLEGIVSARVIADYCEEHIAYQWICGGIKTNHHTLSDFSTKYAEQFDEFLTQSVAILMKQGSIDLEEISQDGMRVRANAGGSSFRREPKLLQCLEKAKQYLGQLKNESTRNPAAARSKKKAAEIRAAEDREKRVKNALEELEKLKEEKKKSYCSKVLRDKKLLENARASTTDPEARKMKMACGGYRAAFNVQFATTKKGRAIVGVDINNQGADHGLIGSMIEIIKKKYGVIPSRWLVDTGYSDYSEITKIMQLYQDCKIYMPPRPTRTNKDPYEPSRNDSEEIIELRKLMSTNEAKDTYKGRSSTAEFSNAQACNKGLRQFFVRGVKKAKAVACRFALTHNMQRYFSMGIVTA